MNEAFLEPDVDLRPWAAYLVGRRPYSLRMRQESLWEALDWEPYREEEDFWGSIRLEIEELNEALGVLALHEQARAAALVELHRATDAFAAACGALAALPEPCEPEEGEDPDPRGLGVGRAPAYAEWRHMLAFSQKVVGPSEDLQRWRDFGAIVGQCLHGLRFSPETKAPPVSPGPGGLPTLAEKLSRGWSLPLVPVATIVGEITDALAESGPGWEIWLTLPDRYLRLSRLEMELRWGLQRQQPPEPVLRLDKDTITFFGITRPLDSYPRMRRELACLWELALRAGMWMRRTDLIRQAGIGTDEVNLKTVISHLRTEILKPLAKQHFDQSNSDPPKEFEYGFLQGRRGGSLGGPYRLDLNPGLVQVVPPKPDWM
jgi:hypothetical protein